MAAELTPALAIPSFDPVFFLLSIPVALALGALVYAWVRKKMAKKKENETEPAKNEIEKNLEKEKVDFDSGFR